MQALNTRFFIDEWLVDPRLHRMVGRGRTVLIEPKVMQVLTCLAAQPGEVIERERLLDGVWGDTIVTDHVLTRSISELRKVFEDDPRRPAVIETIPKTGYRLIAPVVMDDPRAEGTPSPFPGDSMPPHAADVALTPGLSMPSAPASARPAWPPHGLALAGLLVVTAVSAWLLAPTLSEPTRPLRTHLFTSFPGIEAHPVFHGNRMAFTWAEEPGRNPDLYVKQIGDEALLRLTDDAGGVYVPAWSPDGRYLAYRRLAQDRCGLFVISSLGGPERQLVDCSISRSGLAWSPDGHRLALTVLDTTLQPHGLALFTMSTRAIDPLTHPEQPYQRDYMPAFSPDGRRLAFLRSLSHDIADIYVVDVDGTDPPKRLTFDNRYVAGLRWSADGQGVLFSSNRAGNFKLWRMPADGGEPEWLAAVGAYDPGGFSVSAEGNYLAYEEWDYEINVYSLLLTAPDTPDSARRVVASTRWDYHPQVSPDGQRIAFGSNRSGTFEVWVSEADGRRPMRLTTFDGPFVGMPRWSPDGKRLAFDGRVDGRAVLYRIDAAGGPPTGLTDGTTDALAPSWSRDGRWLYFASNREDGWQIWKMPAQGGEAVRVTPEGGYLGFESMDGKTLYFSKYAVPGLWSLPAEGGPETRVVDDLGISDWGNWTVADAGLYYVSRTPEGPVLTHLDPATRETTYLHTWSGPPLSHEPGLSVSPDGQRLFFARADRIESDIVLVEEFR